MDITIATNNSYMSSALSLVPRAISDFNAAIQNYIEARRGAEGNTFPSDIKSLKDVPRYVDNYVARKALLESNKRLDEFPKDAKFPGDRLPKGMLQELVQLSNNINMARLHCPNEEVRKLLEAAQSAYISSSLGTRLQQLVVNALQAQEEVFKAQAGVKGRI